VKNYPKTVEEILNSIDTQQREITEKLRALVKKTLPAVEETVKRGSITYVLDDKNFVRIRNYKTHVDLGFFNGDRLSSLLLKKRGHGTSWRHVEIKSLSSVDDPEIKKLLERGARLFQL
jgi:hypothetical protein